jgi:hypothetical protein
MTYPITVATCIASWTIPSLYLINHDIKIPLLVGFGAASISGIIGCIGTLVMQSKVEK